MSFLPQLSENQGEYIKAGAVCATLGALPAIVASTMQATEPIACQVIKRVNDDPAAESKYKSYVRDKSTRLNSSTGYSMMAAGLVFVGWTGYIFSKSN